MRCLASLERPSPDLSLPVIRVVAVAPGVVKTALWLDNQEKMKLVGEATEEWATPEMVARVMVELVEKDEYEGGTVLEVGKRGQTRRVQVHMDPGPSGGEYTPLNQLEESRDIWRRLIQDGAVSA
ncbi:hypothetical protein VE01_04446 [Pseudogymnoascus verrucosus]|uniref:Uncharacterized protein n=1 Tax=Pseudogymnoascus verrucosus TaxID=342668 RepID=A0A1B8GP31_9PEZI|nr:uncharacterized protein VE01_04446 [Pseudogymnoascus verrucosus]OBT97578.1 hypothetical protein VE01_04446 [Pseudogymnoascus verrucosus]